MRKGLLCLLSVFMLVFVGTAVMAAPYDFGGETVYITLNPHDAIKAFGVNFWDARGEAHIADVEEEFNVKLVFVEDGTETNADAFIANILAGDKVADIQLVHRDLVFFKLAAEGLLTPLTDVLDEEYWENIPLPLQAREFYYFGEELYGFSLVDITGWAIFWNKDLFEANDLPDPYELIENDEWTWETLREILRQGTKDTTGDGEVDQYGAYFDPGIGGTDQIGALMMTNGGAVAKLRDGKVVFTLDEPEAIEAIEFLRTLMFEDKSVLADPNFYRFLQGDTTMVLSHPWWFVPYAGNPDWMSDDTAILPYPIGPNGDPESVKSSYFNANWTWVIPITSKHDPRALVELYNALYLASYDYVLEEPIDRILGEFAQCVTDRRD